MIFGIAKAIAREHSAIDNYDVLLVDLGEVPVLGVTSSILFSRTHSNTARLVAQVLESAP